MPLVTRPLSPSLGVELLEFDPRQLSPSVIDDFRQTFNEKHLVLVRGHDLTEDEHVGLAEQLGPVSSAGATMQGGKRFTLISNVHAEGRLPDGELLFHADHMFMESPLKAISLYGMVVPSKGGETCFMNTADAYESLPEDIKQRISGLQARHIYDYNANVANKAPDRDNIPADANKAVHPVVLTHPDTGKKILFVCRLFTVEIVGLPREESDELLETLFTHIENQKADYVHRWQVGDFLIWDNRILQHARNNYAATEKRAMRRVPIADVRATPA